MEIEIFTQRILDRILERSGAKTHLKQLYHIVRIISLHENSGFFINTNRDACFPYVKRKTNAVLTVHGRLSLNVLNLKM